MNTRLLCLLAAAGISTAASASDLLDVYQMAIDDDATFQSSVYLRQAAANDPDIARSALRPQVNLSADLSRIREDMDSSTAGSGGSDGYNSAGVSVQLDKAAKTGSVDVTIDMTSVDTGSTAFNSHIQGADFLDTAKFPTATFKSTKVVFEGDAPSAIEGNLTIKGITKPVTLDAEFYGAGANPMNKKENVGFVATGTIKRSDFGMGGFVPVVGDNVELKIIVAFQK